MKRPEWAGPDEPFIRLSHSTLEAVRTCERKFAMEKLLTIGAARRESEHFCFGHSFGAFVAMYLETQSFELAILEAWYEYYPIVETDAKNLATAYHLCQASVAGLDELLEEWEVATFQGEPAVELSFRINIDETFYYVGYVDVVLKNKLTGVYAILENKTTGLQIHDIKCLYRFSGQALGYSIVLDEVAGGEGAAAYDVMYFVGRLGKTPLTETTRTETHTFRKNLQDRLEWFLTLGQDVQMLHTCIETDNFPRRVSGCLKFNRECPHFGDCHLRSADHYRKIEKDEIDYQFTYDLDTLIDTHLERAS